MNRKERRAAAKRSPAAIPVRGQATMLDVAGLMAEAQRLHGQGNAAQAEVLCRQIIARVPQHVNALNLLGVIAQASGRHRPAVKLFADAIAADPLNAASHYNLASSCQALGRVDEAIANFRSAIALGLNDRNVEDFLTQSPAIADRLDRLEKDWSPAVADMFSIEGLEAVASDLFLICALETVVIRGRALEQFFTHMRVALLRLAVAKAALSDNLMRLFGALVQQCFINEYLYAPSEEENRQALALRDALLEGPATAAPVTLAAVACYFPLYQLPDAGALLRRAWPASVAGVIRLQLREPLEELRDRPAIPVLTAVDNPVSLQVMQQYEENPYPRWTIEPAAAAIAEARSWQEHEDNAPEVGDILIAGCGSGRHAYHVALQFPASRILAIDISIPSLAYARRKMREAGVTNIEWGQADILKLGSLGRSFDRIESVGVLHHLAEPEAGWRILQSLLRPGGDMRVGLYSEISRTAIVEARALIAERGYRATVEDIRRCRQEILQGDHDGRWKRLTVSADFYSISGCRDLLFNVMEHRFTIPQIADVLRRHGLEFLGFEPQPEVMERFRLQHPAAALNDLDCWQQFELANPQAFQKMYVLLARKPA